MTVRYLKSRRDGTIFERDDILAARSDLYEVFEEDVFPERFVPVAAVEAVEARRGRPRKGKLDLTTDDIPEPPEPENVELNADASRDLPA
jgi:hypothetical protein